MSVYRVSHLSQAVSAPAPFRSWLDWPKNGVSVELGATGGEIRGWALGKSMLSLLVRPDNGQVEEYPLNRMRPDVLAKIAPHVTATGENRNCGFSYEIPFGSAQTDVGFRSDGKDFWLYRIEASTVKDVLVGKASWLFLDNDTNRSVDQFKGELLLSKAALDDWHRYFVQVRRLAAESKIHWCCLVAPAKEEVCADLYPFRRGGTTPIDQYLQTLAEFGEIIFPVKPLVECRDLSYYQVDTHWSDYGAYLAAVEVVEKLGLSNFTRNLVSSFKVVISAGDLGGKLEPQQTGGRLVVDYSGSRTTRIFESGIINVGKVWIYENESCPVKETLLLFGDSFSLNLARLLGTVFRRVVYAHSVATWDDDLVNAEKPAYVLLQTNQRFIINAPNFSNGIWASVKKKLCKMSSDDLRILAARVEKQRNSSCEYYVEKILAEIGCHLKC